MPRKQSLSQSMNRIGRLIHSTLDLREIMERVIAEAAQAVGSDTAAVSLRQGDHWVVSYVHGFPKDVIGAKMDDQQEPHAVLAIQTRKPVVIDDAFTDERVNCEHMKKWGVHSVLVVPLVTEDEVIGVLFFNRHKPGAPFQESHADFADQLASSLSLALRNARLFAEFQAELAQREKAERAHQEANEHLQLQSEELRVANEELQSQAEELRAANEELQAQQEELQTQTEELRVGAQALRESEERYRSLFENMLDGYAYCQMLFDGRGRPTDFIYLSVNDAFIRLTGLENVVGKKVTEVIPVIRASHPELLETYGRVATTGRPERFEMEFEPLGIWLSISVYSPRPGYFTAVFENITGRKRAEEVLKVKDSAIASSLTAVAMADLQGRLTYVNPAFLRLWGYENEHEVLGKSALDFWEEPQRAWEVVQAIQKGEGWEGELFAVAKDGTHRNLYLSASTVRNDDGTPLCMMASFADLTDRKRAEESLRASEARFHQLFEDDLTGDFISTPEGRILLCNPAFAALFGFSRAQEAVGTSIVGLYLDPKERESLVERLRKEGRIERLEVWRKRRDGEPIHIVENLVGQFSEQGELYEIKGYLFEDTERKRAQEALRELNAALENKVAERTAELLHRTRQLQKLTLELSETEDRERKRMAEILHDDLQQIIAGAKFHLTVLRNRVKYDASLQAIGSHIDEMLREAVEKSRTLSHELSPGVLHHSDLTEALGWLANQVKAKHGLIVHLRANGPAHLQSEAIGGFLYKAAQELLFNVVKHARVKEAQLWVRRHGPYVCLSVSDRGRGFDPQGLRQTAGFGLLSIRERIELLGGRMKIKSAKGQGSTFFIVVPNRETPEDRGHKTEDGRKAEEEAPSSVLRSVPSALRLLVADDHRIVREGLRLLLGDEPDIEIVGEAAHGREAVDLALRLEPDVVIMDVAMPLIDGDEATRQIKMHLPRTRVIALSTYNEPEMMQKMYRAGAEGYVLKTASAEELLAAIRGQSAAGS